MWDGDGPGIRCFHIDYARQSHDEGEFHWRCGATFTYDATAAPWQRDFCPHHRQGYRPSDHIMTRQEMDAMNRELTATYRRMTMPEATLDGDGLSAEERDWAEARKRELLEQAKAAGVVV